MKNTTNFPYDVKIVEANRIRLDDHSDHDYFKYKVKLPDGIFYENKYREVDDKIELVADISCSATMFRKVEKANEKNKIEICFPKNKVYGRFTIDLVAVFNDSAVWDNSDVGKGMPVVHLGSFKIDLETRTQGLILFKPNEDTDDVNYSYTLDSIQILLPENKYNWLLKNKHNPLVKNILSSQFAQIALIEACHKMKDGTNDHLLWHKELKNKWKDYNRGSNEFPQDTDIVPFVNEVLQNPSQNLLNYIIENQERDE
jgi:hypothetical protein